MESSAIWASRSGQWDRLRMTELVQSVCNRANWGSATWHLWVSWLNDLCWRKQAFINRVPTLWVAESTPLRALSPTGSRSFLAPQKATSQNDGQISPISLSVIKLVTQMDLHHLWNVHLRFSGSPSSRSSSLLQGLWCTVLSLYVAVQETMCCITLSQRVDPREAHEPSVGSCIQEWAPHFLLGPSPWWAPHLQVPWVLSAMWGTGPEAQNIQMSKTQRERACIKFWSPIPRDSIPREWLLLKSWFPGHSAAPSISHVSVCSARQGSAAPTGLLPSSPNL